MSPLPISPAVSLWEKMPFFRAFFYVSFRDPSKTTPSRFPHRTPVERDPSFPDTSSTNKSPVNEPLSSLPSGSPTETDTRLLSPHPLIL